MSELPFLTSPLTSHDQVINRAREIGRASGLARVVIAAAEEDDVLAAMYACKRDGIADALLVGRPKKIRKALALAKVPEESFETVETSDDGESAVKAAEIAGSGDADIVMKGFLKTSTLLKTLLKHDYGLRDRELVSHSAVLFIPRYGKLLNITDGGTLIQPTLEEKLTVIANGYGVMRAVGVERPKVAVLAPVEEVFEEVPETVEADRLVRAATRDWSPFLDIEGPLPLDLVVRKPVHPGEEFESDVAGDADILLVHGIEQGNIIAKTLIQFGEAVFMGVIAGARVPISLVSRSDTMINKMASIALAVCLVDYQRRGFAPLPAPSFREGIE